MGIFLQRETCAGIRRHHVEHILRETEAALGLLAASSSYFFGRSSDWRQDARFQCLTSLEEALCILLRDIDCLWSHLFERNNLRFSVLDPLPRTRAERH